LNKIYHPNINYNGKVCLPLIREDYSPMVSLVSIICGLIFILSYPDGEDALNVEIGDLMKKDYQLYKKIVLHTIEGRIHKNQLYDNVKINKN
jgi:ubiquitin-conjugating enzyme E2 M